MARPFSSCATRRTGDSLPPGRHDGGSAELLVAHSSRKQNLRACPRKISTSSRHRLLELSEFLSTGALKSRNGETRIRNNLCRTSPSRFISRHPGSGRGRVTSGMPTSISRQLHEIGNGDATSSALRLQMVEN